MLNKHGGVTAMALQYPESLFLKLEAGTIARIDDALERFEARSHMVREAIEREIKRRERQGPRAR
jgi:hypothetical protein